MSQHKLIYSTVPLFHDFFLGSDQVKIKIDDVATLNLAMHKLLILNVMSSKRH
jgi:hypothetical protein